jgi:hypothetical protein
MANAKTKKCTFAWSVSYPVGVKPAYVKKIDQNKSSKERREEIYTGEYYRVVEAQSENKTEEKRLSTDLPTEFV